MYPAITLKSHKTEIAYHHPWIFSGAIAKIDPHAKDGDVVRVIGHDGTFLCLASYSENSTIALRRLSFNDEVIDSHFWLKKLESCLERRKNLDIECGPSAGYRLCFGEADQTPGLVIDNYASNAVIVASTSCMRLQIPHIETALNQLGLSSHIIVKNEGDDVGSCSSSHQAEQVVWFKRDGQLYLADISGGQKTGFFLDQSPLRGYLSSMPRKPESILNLFSYTGSLGVAASSPTSLTVHVDSSDRALRLATDLFASRDLTTHTCVKADVFEYLSSRQSLYEMVIVDPPALIKRRSSKTQGSKAYYHLNAKASLLVKPGGFLVTSTCSHYMEPDQFIQLTRSAIAPREAQLLAHTSQALDHPIVSTFPESRYLTSLVWKLL